MSAIKLRPYGIAQLPSASELQRAIACPASFATEGIVEEAGEAAQRGTTVHEFIRRVLSGESVEAALEAVPHDDPGRQLCEQLDTALLPQGGEQEVALAWNPATEEGRVLGHNIQRAYEAHGADRAAELVGSIDFAGMITPQRLVILDFKSGKRTRADASWQLKGLGVMGAAAFGATEVLAGLGFIRGDRISWDFVELDALALGQARARLHEMCKALGQAHTIRFEQAPLAEGEHCFYCPAWKRCPAKTALVRKLSGIADGDHAWLPVQPDQAAAAWRLLERYDEISKRARAELEQWAAREPIDLGDGRTLRLAPGEMRDHVLDGPGAIRALAEETDEACATAAIKTTKGAIEDAAAEYARRVDVPIARVKKAVIEALRGRGLIAKVPGEQKVRIVRADRMIGEGARRTLASRPPTG